MSDPSPTLSVLVPAYNVAAYVAAAVDSALAQTYPHIEVVIVDDGATDETAAIVASYADRAVVVRQENRGLAGARNTALAHATGDLIGLLDADDIWEPARAERIVEAFAQRPGLGVVTSDAWIIDEDTVTSRRYYADHLGRPFPATHDEQLRTIARENFVFVGGVVRRAVFDRIGGFDERLRRAEDYDLWCRALLAGVEFAVVDEPLAQYRVRAGSLSANRAAQWDAHLTVLERHFDAFAAAGVDIDPTAAYDLARRAEREGRGRDAMRRYFSAARGLRATSRARAAKLQLAGVRARVHPQRATQPAAGPPGIAGRP